MNTFKLIFRTPTDEEGQIYYLQLQNTPNSFGYYVAKLVDETFADKFLICESDITIFLDKLSSKINEVGNCIFCRRIYNDITTSEMLRIIHKK